MILVIAAVLGVPVSAAAYAFLALVSYLQTELFVHLPHGLGMSAQPVWWPVPVLLIGGVLVGLAIRSGAARLRGRSRGTCLRQQRPSARGELCQ